jgi:cell wall-associated NlpC family hydrolase
VTPYFSTPARVDALVASAVSWLGTPFAGNCRAKGRGASCQTLAAGIYADAGFEVGEVPEAPMHHARYSSESIVVPWVESSGKFQRVESGDVQPGDLLGFRIGRCVHHVGVLLNQKGQHFAHVIEGGPAKLSTLMDATWRSRLEYVWRPVQ